MFYPEKKMAIRLNVVALLLFLTLLALSIYQFSLAIQEQQLFIGRFDESITNIKNPNLLANKAKEKHLFEADLPGAIQYLQQALFSSTYYVPAYLNLAEVYFDSGKKSEAISVLNYVDQLTQGVKRWRWEKALTAYQLGKVEILPQELSYIIKEIPGKTRSDALKLAFTLWDDPKQLLDNVGEENLPYLLSHAIRRQYPDKGLYFWQFLEKQDWDRKQLLFFINMLVEKNYLADASAIWRKHINGKTIIYNSNFEMPLLNIAFGWRNLKLNTVAFGYEFNNTGKLQGGAHLRFKGWENVKYHHLYQIVPIEASKSFIFSAQVKSHKLTTNEKPFFEIYGYRCKINNRRTKQFENHDDWQIYSTQFYVPEGCQTVAVRLRRLESNHIDNKIEGQVWIKNIQITETKTPDQLSDNIKG